MANSNAPDQMPQESKFTPVGTKNTSRARMNALKARIKKPRQTLPLSRDTTKLM